jgi:hypothetical protein
MMESPAGALPVVRLPVGPLRVPGAPRPGGSYGPGRARSADKTEENS